MILCSISLATKSGILFVESEILFFDPQELWNVIQSKAEQAERSILRSPSAARRSKAKRGIKFQSEWGSKNEFQSRFLGYHFELQNVY